MLGWGVSRKAVGTKEALTLAETMTLEQARTLIARDSRPDEQPSRLNPNVTVGKARSVFLAVLEAASPETWKPRYEQDFHGKWRRNGQLLIASNIIREFGRPRTVGGGE